MEGKSKSLNNKFGLSENDINKLKELASAKIEESATELAAVSKEIWSNPELYFKEFKAHKLLTDFLESSGFTVQRSYKIETGFRATFTTNSICTPNIAVLCEYDALPDIGHACGHNLIAEVGVGASIGVKAALEQTKLNLGRLTVLGCPAEEEGGGKLNMIEGGAFTDVDAAMMSHPSNFGAVHTNFNALQEVRVVYRGVSSHAACEPFEGVNALDAAVMAYTSISCLRQQMKPSCRVHGIITKGGSTPNIIPDEAELFYYIRAPTNTDLDELVTKVAACFEAAAVASGCTVELIWDEHRYKDLITNRTMASLYEANANKLGIEFNPDDLPENVGSTDMGNVSYVVPSIHPHFYFGAKHPEHSQPFATQAGSTEAQEYAIREAKALAHTVLDLLANPELLEEAKKNFEEDLARLAADTTKQNDVDARMKGNGDQK